MYYLHVEGTNDMKHKSKVLVVCIVIFLIILFSGLTARYTYHNTDSRTTQFPEASDLIAPTNKYENLVFYVATEFIDEQHYFIAPYGVDSDWIIAKRTGRICQHDMPDGSYLVVEYEVPCIEDPLTQFKSSWNLMVESPVDAVHAPITTSSIFKNIEFTNHYSLLRWVKELQGEYVLISDPLFFCEDCINTFGLDEKFVMGPWIKK